MTLVSEVRDHREEKLSTEMWRDVWLASAVTFLTKRSNRNFTSKSLQVNLHFSYLPRTSLSCSFSSCYLTFTQPSKPCLGTPNTTMSAALTTNVDQRALRTTKFPPEFNVKVDMRKVNAQLIKNWVTEEISKLLKSEDDVVTELVSNILDENRFVRIYCHLGHTRECVLTA